MLFNLSVLIQQDINHVYYETEFRIEWCRSNSTLVPCFLFARKFSQGAAMRLLSDGVVGRSDATELLDSLPWFITFSWFSNNQVTHLEI